VWNLFSLAELFRVTPETLEEQILKGRLRATQDSEGDWWVTTADLEAYLQRKRGTHAR
jgi:predicted site-specific integrase-resolvase